MTPIDGEIYNIIFEAVGGIGSDRVHERSQLSPNLSTTVASLHTLQELGKVRCGIVNKRRLYKAVTKAEIDRAKAEIAAAPPPQESASRGSVKAVADTHKRPSQPAPPATPPAARDIKGRRAAESKLDQDTAARRAAYDEGFNHGMIHACAGMAGVTDMPREQAIEHYWQISQAGRKERAA